MTDTTLAAALAQLGQDDDPAPASNTGSNIFSPIVTADVTSVPPDDNGHQDQADDPGPARCPEMTRTERGWERCRRDDGPHDRHHVRGRAWSTGPAPRLDLGHACTEPGCCRWPDLVVPYLGYVPGAADIRASRQPSRGRARK